MKNYKLLTVQKTRNSNMSSSITIQWTDGVSTNKVEQVVGKYEKIDRCEATGEILSGANTYIFCNRNMSDKAKETIKRELNLSIETPEWALNQFIRKKFNETDL